MAILIEAISVVVRRDSIEAKYRGGWRAFLDDVPNSTLCADDEIACVAFMAPEDVGAFVTHLEENRLRFLEGGRPVDLAVADQQHGLTTPCDWLRFAKFKFENRGQVSVCWLFEGPSLGAGIPIRSTSLNLATPAGWSYEGSLSQSVVFVPTGQENERVKFLRSENGVEVYLDLDTGKEVFVGRTP